jgi:hypothetical protein
LLNNPRLRQGAGFLFSGVNINKASASYNTFGLVIRQGGEKGL